MTLPVDGLAGSLWRTATFPLRALAPVGLQLRRAIRGDYWVETTEVRPSADPVVEMGPGEQVQTPDDGVGPLNRRRYQVRIEGATVDAVQLLEMFRSDPNRFSPTSFAVFVPDPAPGGLTEGADVEVKLPGPWDGPVRVSTITPQVVRLETLDGHMEAGRIEFSTDEHDGVLTFTIDSLATSGDEAFDWLYRKARVGKLFQSEMWAQVLEAAVQVSGGRQQGRLHFSTTVMKGDIR